MSDLVSTGGGHNHPAGCGCPWCTSTAHDEANVTLNVPVVGSQEYADQIGLAHFVGQATDEELHAAIAAVNDDPGRVRDDPRFLAEMEDVERGICIRHVAEGDWVRNYGEDEWSVVRHVGLHAVETDTWSDDEWGRVVAHVPKETAERIVAELVNENAHLEAVEPEPWSATRVWDRIRATDLSGEPCTIELPGGRTATVTHTVMPEFNEYGGPAGRKGTYTVRIDGDIVDEYHYHRAGRTGSDAVWLAAELVSRKATEEVGR